MNRAFLSITLLLAALAPAMASTGSIDADTGCRTGSTRVELNFPSGAAWTLCAGTSPNAALQVHAVAYRAPGDTMRPVLAELHAAGIRIHHHDRPGPIDLPAPASPPADGSARPSGPACPADARSLRDDPALCLSSRSSGLLLRYGDISGGQAERRHLDLWQRLDDGSTLRSRVSFGETGTLEPGMSLQAPAERLPPLDSSLSVTWRLAFALDTPAADRVEEFEFELRERLGSRRLMVVTPLLSETVRRIRHERFTGWRVLDVSGAGYYLDSQRAIASWSDGTPSGDAPGRFALTAARGGEDDARQLAGYLNGESLADRNTIVWYTSTTLGVPARHRGATSLFTTGFTLLPFDWSPNSPFAPAPPR